MSKRINKPVASIKVYERGGRTVEAGCVEIIGGFEVGATNAKAAIAIMANEFGNARRFFVPNEQVVIEAQSQYGTLAFGNALHKLARTRSRQRRTSLPHGKSKLHRGEIKELF